jgi:hypothetical protein
MANDEHIVPPPALAAPAVIVTDPPAAVAVLSWEEWAAKKSIPFWKAEAARHGRAWPIGREVTEDAFNQAMHDAFNSRIG